MQSPYQHILFVGPDHHNHRGGIGAVLSIYSKNIEPFNFIPTLSYRNKFYELWFYAKALTTLFFQLTFNRKIKIVHIHGAKEGSILRKYFVTMIARKIFGKKLIFHIHAGGFDEYYRQHGRLYKHMCKFIINNSSALVALSERWNDFFHENFKIKRLMVIRNPVEHTPAIDTTPADSNLVTFLFLGRIADHKGIFDLLNIVVKEQDALRGKCRFLVGGNHEIERLQNEIKEGGVSDMVEYIGWVQDADKHKALAGCDYFILPTYEEGMPMTILEAFSYGKPVITTPVGSIPEVVSHEKNGILFNPGDVETLKNILFSVINDRSSYEHMSRNAKATAIDYYPESIKKELESLYAEIFEYDRQTEMVL